MPEVLLWIGLSEKDGNDVDAGVGESRDPVVVVDDAPFPAACHRGSPGVPSTCQAGLTKLFLLQEFCLLRHRKNSNHSYIWDFCSAARAFVGIVHRHGDGSTMSGNLVPTLRTRPEP